MFHDSKSKRMLKKLKKLKRDPSNKFPKVVTLLVNKECKLKNNCLIKFRRDGIHNESYQIV
jgi:hypothetical protein